MKKSVCFAITIRTFLVHKIFLDKLKEIIPRYVDGKLIDIGCGEKPCEDLFSPYITEYIGRDHQNTLHDKSKIELFGTAYDIPSEDEHFDTVLCTAVLEHLEEPDKAIKEANRILKSGGYVIYTVPLFWHLHEEPRDFYRYTKYGLKYLFEKNGFEIAELKANTGYWIMAGLRFNYYLARFGRGYLKYLLSPIYYLVQVLSLVLDKIDKVETDTASYLLVARKI